MGFTNSPLVSYTKLSPNNSGVRTHSIDRITPHCVVGQCSVEALGALFAQSSRQASSNYGIGVDGRVGMYVPESSRSWCSGGNLNVNGQTGSQNDQRAVTIECASDASYPYAFNNTVYNKLIELCVDICRRNGKKKLLWISDKYKACAYQPADDEMVLSLHRWFATKSCPGEWLVQRMDDLANKVTKQLGGSTAPVSNGNDTPATPPAKVGNTCVVTLPVLQRGSRGSYVKVLQRLLIAQNFSCGGCGADGDFGAGTLSAVKNFQSYYKLGADGIVGQKTWSKLLGG